MSYIDKAEVTREYYRQQGRDEMFADIIKRFEGLHDEYLAQGDEVSANLVVDLVAWLQDDEGGMSESFSRSHSR
jgi:hypothetical protein